MKVVQYSLPKFCNLLFWIAHYKKQSLSPVHHASTPLDNNPVDDLNKGDDAETEEKAKDSAKRGDIVNWSHLDAPLKF